MPGRCPRVQQRKGTPCAYVPVADCGQATFSICRVDCSMGPSIVLLGCGRLQPISSAGGIFKFFFFLTEAILEVERFSAISFDWRTFPRKCHFSGLSATLQKVSTTRDPTRAKVRAYDRIPGTRASAVHRVGSQSPSVGEATTNNRSTESVCSCSNWMQKATIESCCCTVCLLRFESPSSTSCMIFISRTPHISRGAPGRVLRVGT